MPYLQAEKAQARFQGCVEACHGRNRVYKNCFAPGWEGKDETIGSGKVMDVHDGYIRLRRSVNLL